MSGLGYFTFLYQHTKYTIERMEEKNNHGLWLVLSAREGGVCDTFVLLSVHLQAITGGYLRETSTKPLGMLTYLIALVNPASVGQQVLAAAFLTSVDWSPLCPGLISWPTRSVNWSLLLSSADCVLLASLGPSFPRPLPVSWEISRTGPLCGFRAKTDKGILWPASTHTETNATHCVTIISM